MKALDNALICAILAPAGPHRSRMLGTLFKDERSQRSPAYSMLNKMYEQQKQTNIRFIDLNDILLRCILGI